MIQEIDHGSFRASVLCIRYPSNTAEGTSLSLIHSRNRREVPTPVICMQRTQSLRWKSVVATSKGIVSR